MGGHVECMGERSIMDFAGDTVGRRSLGRPTHRWEDNIRIDFKEIGWEGMDWIDVPEHSGRWWAPVNAVMNLKVP
jgi:hypothetical protein